MVDLGVRVPVTNGLEEERREKRRSGGSEGDKRRALSPRRP